MIFLSIFIRFYLFFFRRQRRNFLYRTHVNKQVPAERLSGLSGLNGFSLMGKPLLGLILITRIRASRGSCNHPDGLSPRKRKSAESVIIGVNKSD